MTGRVGDWRLFLLRRCNHLQSEDAITDASARLSKTILNLSRSFSRSANFCFKTAIQRKAARIVIGNSPRVRKTPQASEKHTQKHFLEFSVGVGATRQIHPIGYIMHGTPSDDGVIRSARTKWSPCLTV
jgi:hypothetical protein